MWPATELNLGITSPVSGTYVAAMQFGQGALTISYGNNANVKIQGSTLGLVATTNANGDIARVCGTRATPAGFTPAPGTAVNTVLDKYQVSNCRL